MKLILALVFGIILNRVTYSQLTVYDTISSGGLARDYRMYVPASYNASVAAPLLFNLHGYSSDNFGQAIYANFNPIADTAGFLVVLPNGTFDEFGYRFWNCFGPDGIGVDDIQFISDLIDSIALNYNIDFNRIYSTGMSNGGFMSHALACELSDRVAAIASVAGSISAIRLNYCDAHHNMPVLQIHGTDDPIVPYDGNDVYLSVDSVIHYWADHNHCNSDPEFTAVPDYTTADSSTAEHYVYGNCWKNSNVELFKIIGGEHTWPGSPIIFLGVTNQDINACTEIWKFVSRYRLDQLTGNEQPATDEINKFSVYPNPAHQVLFLATSANLVNIEIQIFNVSGTAIYHNTEFKSEIDISEWPDGVYLIRIKTPDGSAVSEFVKQ